MLEDHLEDNIMNKSLKKVTLNRLQHRNSPIVASRSRMVHDENDGIYRDYA